MRARAHARTVPLADEYENDSSGEVTTTTNANPFSAMRRSQTCVDHGDNDEDTVRLHSWAIPEGNYMRTIWETALIVMLIYVGTIFPFRLAFVTFRIPKPEEDCPDTQEGPIWNAFDWFIDIFFWCDLVLGFFFTFRRKSDQREEFRMRRIAGHYLRTYFFVNLIACLPAMAFQPIIDWLNFIPPGGCDDSSQVNKAGLFARMQRMTKIARLTRLIRLMKLMQISKMLHNNRFLQLLRDMRSLRIINWVLGLSWIVHLVSCGWYLTAALHVNPEDTWVGRRVVSVDPMKTLQSEDSFAQWVNAMYFVLTVFTTVGFGDISAVTVGEIIYLNLTMLMGAIVHSIVVGEVVSVVNELDETASQRRRQKTLLNLFVKQTYMGNGIQEKLLNWVDDQDPTAQTSFDHNEMRKLLTAGAVPRKLLGDIPKELFRGELMRNQFIITCSVNFENQMAPPRFPVLLATMLSSFTYKAGDIVYQMHDYSMCMYLVLSGTFACIAQASDSGGQDCKMDNRGSKVSDKKLKRRNSIVRALTFQKTQTADFPDRKTEDMRVINPPEESRTYSSCSSGVVVHSALNSHKGSWAAAKAERGEYMQLDLGGCQTVLGIAVQGRPDADEWVTELSVQYSTDGDAWHEVISNFTACFDRHTQATALWEPVQCRFLRIEPQRWHNGIAMRAGVLVRNKKLSPYRLFGYRSYFGDKETLLGGTRDSTVRCEADGQVLLLRKSELSSILQEFPQVNVSLRCCAVLRDGHRRDMLARHRSAVNYRQMAVMKLQSFFRARRHARGKLSALSQDSVSTFSPIPPVGDVERPRSSSSTQASHASGTHFSATQATSPSQGAHHSAPDALHAPPDIPRLLSESQTDAGCTDAMVQGLAADVSALRAEQREIKALLQAVVSRLSAPLGEPDGTALPT